MFRIKYYNLTSITKKLRHTSVPTGMLMSIWNKLKNENINIKSKVQKLYEMYNFLPSNSCVIFVILFFRVREYLIYLSFNSYLIIQQPGWVTLNIKKSTATQFTKETFWGWVVNL